MSTSDDYDHLTTDDSHYLRQYLVRAAKPYLCVSCWFALWIGLLAYGPPAMSVPSGPSHPSGVVAVITGVVLAGGTATLLTIALAVAVRAGIDRARNVKEQDGTTALDSVDDESHV